MKKHITVIILALLAGYTASAQVDPHAIGLRLGGGSGYGVEFSYQHGFGSDNRLELDLGFGGNNHYSRIGLVGIYQWVWNIGNDGFNWFIGPGAGLAMNSGKDNYDNYFGLAIGGQVGLGFNFNIPLQLTLDTRPMFDVLADTDGFGWGISLGVRYRF